MAVQSETSVEARLALIASGLEPEALAHLLAFAEFLEFQNWRAERQSFALANLERAYGDDEPDYAATDTGQ